jgi:hypothetical protein
VAGSVDLLSGCFGRIDAVVAELEGLKRGWERECPEVKKAYDEGEVERMFAESYTTETEREVLRAALHGTGLPAAPPTLAGNSVELF